MCCYRCSVHGLFPAHHSHHHWGVGHPLLPAMGLFSLLHIYPAHHCVFGSELLQLSSGSCGLCFLQLYVQESSAGCNAMQSAQHAGRPDLTINIRKSVNHSAGAEIYQLALSCNSIFPLLIFMLITSPPFLSCRFDKL